MPQSFYHSAALYLKVVWGRLLTLLKFSHMKPQILKSWTGQKIP